MRDHRGPLVASKVACHARERLLITRQRIGERGVLLGVRFGDSLLFDCFQLRMRESVSFQQVPALEAFRTDVADERAASMIGLLFLSRSFALNDGCFLASFLFGYLDRHAHRWLPTTLRENIFITVPQFGYL